MTNLLSAEYRKGKRHRNADSLTRKFYLERDCKFCQSQDKKNSTVLQNMKAQGNDETQIRLSTENLIKDQELDPEWLHKKVRP